MGNFSESECRFDPDQLLVKLDVTLPGTVEAIQPTVDQIMGVVGQQQCAIGKEFEVEVALLEALANAVKYGCRDDPAKSVDLNSLSSRLRIPSITIEPLLQGLERNGLLAAMENEDLVPGRDMSRIRLSDILAVVRSEGETGSYQEPRWARAMP